MPMPVLPLVGSISVSPGLMRPLFSASATIAQPMRSLTEPPGFRNSHFAHRVQGRCAPTRLSRTSGVRPMASRIESKRMPSLSGTAP